jgi:glycosyltransferase involved in cell wall biosynthesis
VGSIHPRKGVATLLKAFVNIAPETARLTLVGRLGIPPATFQRFRHRVNHVGSMTRSEVVKHFLAADCFLFPSLFEGGGIVLYEACAAGLGIIQSAYCGDGVRDARNGQILAEVSTPALAAAVSALANEPPQLERWQAASWEMRLDRTWQRYRQRIVELAAA